MQTAGNTGHRNKGDLREVRKESYCKLVFYISHMKRETSAGSYAEDPYTVLLA
jgi:hypothetical protein